MTKPWKAHHGWLIHRLYLSSLFRYAPAVRFASYEKSFLSGGRCSGHGGRISMSNLFVKTLRLAAVSLGMSICLLSLSTKSEDYELQATVQTPEITFESDTDIGLWARFHFAIHTEDFDSTREFYRRLGFTQARTGFAHQYPCDGARFGHVRSLPVRAGKRRGAAVSRGREYNRHRFAAVARAV